MGPSFAHIVQRVPTETGMAPSALCLEVTESVFLADAPRALAVLADIKALGFQAALDDFGTGYPSLAYLRQLPVDIVKIDRSCTAALPEDKVTAFIVGAITGLGHVLDLTVIAEGVETAAELSALTDVGADQVQGFHLSHPLPCEEFATYVSSTTGR